MSIKTTHLVLSIASLFTAASLAATVFVVYTVHTQGTELEGHVQAIANSNEKIKAYKDLLVQYERTTAERHALSEFALIEDEAGSFLTEIEKIGVARGVTIKTNSLKVEKQKGSPDQLLVQFFLEGTKEAVHQVITAFETLPYHSSLSSLTLSVLEEGTVASIIDLKVSLVKYDK